MYIIHAGLGCIVHLQSLIIFEPTLVADSLDAPCQEYGVDLPIVESVYKVLFDGTDIKEALGTLFMRSVKKEF